MNIFPLKKAFRRVAQVTGVRIPVGTPISQKPVNPTIYGLFVFDTSFYWQHHWQQRCVLARSDS
jgi:hypothetical protein